LQLLRIGRSIKCRQSDAPIIVFHYKHQKQQGLSIGYLLSNCTLIQDARIQECNYTQRVISYDSCIKAMVEMIPCRLLRHAYLEYKYQILKEKEWDTGILQLQLSQRLLPRMP